MKFNKKLARLESLYNIKKNNIMIADPIHISDFIHYALENPEKYRLEGINKDWFRSKCVKAPDVASKIVKNILLENGFNVSSKSIIEGIELFKVDE